MNGSKYIVKLECAPVGGGAWPECRAAAAARAVERSASVWIGTPWWRSSVGPSMGSDCASLVMCIAAALSGLRCEPPKVDSLRVSLDPDLSFAMLTHFSAVFKPTFHQISDRLEPGDVIVELGSSGAILHTSMVSEAPPSVYTSLVSTGMVRTVLDADPASSFLVMRLPDRHLWSERI